LNGFGQKTFLVVIEITRNILLFVIRVVVIELSHFFANDDVFQVALQSPLFSCITIFMAI